MIRPILKYGDSVLHEKARVVDAITPDIDRLVDDMIETMYAAPGVGLAAPQVGVPFRIFVVDVSVGRDPAGLIVMINPEFIERDGVQLEEEGCLSVPGLRGLVSRHKALRYTGYDQRGTPIDRTVSGFHARVVQHECDHIDGILYPLRLKDIRLLGFEDALFPELARPESDPRVHGMGESI